MRARRNSDRDRWHQEDRETEEVCCSKELRTCENVPDSACQCRLDEGAYCSILITNRRVRNAHRAGCSIDGGGSPETLWRNRTGGALADRGTGGPGKRRLFVRQR